MKKIQTKPKSAAAKKPAAKAAKPKAEAKRKTKNIEVQQPVEQVVVPETEQAPAIEEAQVAPEVQEPQRTIEPAEDLVPLSEILRPKAKKTKAKAKVATAPEASTPRPLSCLDAAVQVLKDKGQPMRCKDMIEAMAAAGLWTSNAPTPAATLSSAILREMTIKGDQSRFQKTGRGHFALTPAATK